MRVPIGRTSNIESTNWQLADIHKIKKSSAGAPAEEITDKLIYLHY